MIENISASPNLVISKTQRNAARCGHLMWGLPRRGGLESVMPLKGHVPQLRSKKSGRYDYAVVTLRDSVSNERRDIQLGQYGTTASIQKYARVVEEWLLLGRRLTPRGELGRTVAVVLDSWAHAKLSNYSSNEQLNLSNVIKRLKVAFGSMPATEFGPLSLQAFRSGLIAENLTKKYINSHVNRIRLIWKWAVSMEILEPKHYEALRAVGGLKTGEARENPPVKPVSVEHVEQTLPFIPDQFRAVVRLQLLTAARPSEILGLRLGDFIFNASSYRHAYNTDSSSSDHGGIWIAELASHKTHHQGKSRRLYFGPEAQAVLKPLIQRAMSADPGTFLFVDNTSMTKPGSSATHLRRDSYSKAIRRACEQAFLPDPPLRKLPDETKRAYENRLTEEQKEELKAHRLAHHWSPHRLRHTAATLIRERFGLELASIILGHSSMIVTDAVYAERNERQIINAIREIG